ncbi:hypothetical protein [Paracoccus thiocyanatus]|uniref:Uncharacterized protein n=1 Tax=Paracoccus thiocyanatus TaxID=34006 RepID=A0A3D8PF61_9RHOB|nr:hypothetical protein [Paracoccus thiocyanatus]RDW13908.1 hypothetical protein DIE28_05530 [Paracoccus thiocyanatus]
MTDKDKGEIRNEAQAPPSDRAAERAARQAANRAEREARRQARQAERARRRDSPAAEVPAAPPASTGVFNILVVGQGQRLGMEALLFAASLRRHAPGWGGRLIVAEPRPEGAWAGAQTAMPGPIRDALTGFGAEILPFTAQHFGAGYPYGNKIEALAVLPPGEPFIFFDSDTLVTGPLDRLPLEFSRPSASMRRTGTWPEPPLYGPGYGAIWKSLYDRFGLDYESSLDPGQPDEHWERYLYFNAGWFFGADPQEFGRRFLDWALAIREEPGEALASQTLDVLLDQVALPLVIHALGGGRPGPGLAGLDGDVTCHYRDLSLLYARESDLAVETVEAVLHDPRLKTLAEAWEPARAIVLQGVGLDRIRPMFQRDRPLNEGRTRQMLKKAGLWLR